MKKVLITVKVTTHFFIRPFEPITCTLGAHPTADPRLKGYDKTQALKHRLLVSPRRFGGHPGTGLLGEDYRSRPAFIINVVIGFYRVGGCH